jgi:hypothetical protein
MHPHPPPPPRAPRTVLRLCALWLALLPLLGPPLAAAGPDPTTPSTWSGRHLMEQVRQRTEIFPYVYQEQTMALLDAAGERDTRRTRLYSRLEDDGGLRLLLVFDYPREVRGLALLAVRDPAGTLHASLYLPALGELRQTRAEHSGGQLLGTDFALHDLLPEVLDQHRYERRADELRDGLDYYVIDALPLDPQMAAATGYARRRHAIRKDLLVIDRTDFFDLGERLHKRLSFYDLKGVEGGGWAPGMVLMEDLRRSHQTVLRIDRLVYSADYVPARIFEPAWLLANRHVQGDGAAPPQAAPAAGAAPVDCAPHGDGP